MPYIENIPALLTPSPHSLYMGKTAPSSAITGLDFPGNAGVTTTMRFQFTNPQNIGTGLLCHGSSGDGNTYIWRSRYRPQTATPGYFTNFFYSDDDNWFEGGGAGDGYGMHPYPVNASGNSDNTVLDRHIHSLADNADWPAGQSFWADYLVTYNIWYLHVVRIINNGGGAVTYQYYPDYENDITLLLDRDYTGRGEPVDPVLAWGDAPHAPGQEVMSGVFRDIHVYNTLLSLAEIDSEIASAGSSGNTPWYYKENPTPTNIDDESGNGHDPSWVGAERPDLYQGP